MRSTKRLHKRLTIGKQGNHLSTVDGSFSQIQPKAREFIKSGLPQLLPFPIPPRRNEERTWELNLGKLKVHLDTIRVPTNPCCPRASKSCAKSKSWELRLEGGNYSSSGTHNLPQGEVCVALVYLLGLVQYMDCKIPARVTAFSNKGNKAWCTRCLPSTHALTSPGYAILLHSRFTQGLVHHQQLVLDGNGRGRSARNSDLFMQDDT